MRTYLGVDQSLRGTGLVVLSDAGDILLQRLVRPAARRGVERLAYIRGELQAALTAHRPAHAALEGYSYDSTGKVFQLGEVGGLVQLAFWDAGVPFEVVAPAALKKFVANNHQATKTQMLAATRKKWHTDFGDDDNLCDAHGLAQILRAMACSNTIVRHELEVIQALREPPKKPSAVRRTAKSKVKISI